MKIYKKQPIYLIRIQIKRQGDSSTNITLCETTMDDVFNFLIKLISSNTTGIIEGRKTTIEIREAWGGKNGKNKSFSFYGLSPKETEELILNHLQ